MFLPTSEKPSGTQENSVKRILQVFPNAFAKGLAKILQITVCDGIINLLINKSTCYFCLIIDVLCDLPKNIKCTFTVFIYYVVT